MTNTRATQGHKVVISAGGSVPGRATQGHKIVLLTTGATSARAIQGYKILLVRPESEAPSGVRRRNFMSYSP